MIKKAVKPGKIGLRLFPVPFFLPSGAVMALGAAAMMLALALSPELCVEYARKGVDLFLRVMLPSQLPFLICALLLSDCGAVRSLGRKMEGIMRRVFAQEGRAGFAMLMGGISGYPTGARITSEIFTLRDDIRDIERCAMLSSLAGPAYMISAVGVGMLGSAAAGWFIAVSHWSAVLLTSMIFSIGRPRRITMRSEPEPIGSVSPGRVLGDAVRKGMETFWSVGGFIIFFCVLTGLLQESGAFSVLAEPLKIAFRWMGWNGGLAQASLCAVVEVANGSAQIAAVSAPMAQKCILLSALISFGGASVMMQQLAFLSPIGVSGVKLMAAKALQAILAALICTILCYLAPQQTLEVSAGMGGLPDQGLGGGSLWAITAASAAVLWFCSYDLPRIWSRFCRTRSR